MGISCYLAMTAAEMETAVAAPNWHTAYMACHFSSYSTGLSNIPTALPPNSMLIVNDRTPISNHDPDLIAAQLQQTVETLGCNSVLLDFQRPGNAETEALCRVLVGAIPCPVGISDLYAKGLDCPVFLPPAPLDQPLEAFLAPWKPREIWLEAATDATCITVTEKGSTHSPVDRPQPPKRHFLDQTLHCWYWTGPTKTQARFYLWRDSTQLKALLDEAEALGVPKAVGLYQQLGSHT